MQNYKSIIQEILILGKKKKVCVKIVTINSVPITICISLIRELMFEPIRIRI